MHNTKDLPAPKDRQIRIIANIVYRDGCLTEVEAYRGLAQWDARCQDWLNECALSIRMDYDSELIVLEWEEVCEIVLRSLPGRRYRESREAVSMIRALKPLPPALPAPAWMSDFGHPAHREIYKLTDAALEQRLDAQSQFMTYLLDGGGERWHLWDDHYQGAETIESELEREAGKRWLRARQKARLKAAERPRKKARAAA